jgi:hypothetical protein
MGITNKQRGGQLLPGLGQWQDIPFDPANFYCSGAMTWTLTPPLLTNRYCRIGNAVFWNVVAPVTTLGGTPGLNLFVKCPTGMSKYAMGTGLVLNGAPAVSTIVKGNAGNPGLIGIGLQANAAFVLGSCQVQFSITYEFGNP